MTDINFQNDTITLVLDFSISTDTIEVNLEFLDINTKPDKVIYDFDFNRSTTIIRILKSQDNIFKLIWCDPEASLTRGRIYVAHEKDLTILNRRDGQTYIENYISKTVLGTTNETLSSDSIQDFNVIF